MFKIHQNYNGIQKMKNGLQTLKHKSRIKFDEKKVDNKVTDIHINLLQPLLTLQSTLTIEATIVNTLDVWHQVLTLHDLL